MPWQKVTKWISESRIQVQSKSGNDYPAEVAYDHMADGLYSQLMNEAHDEYTFWAWINFDGDKPVVEDWTKNKSGDYPGNPPWNRG